MKKTTFEFDGHTTKLLSDLQSTFGVRTNSEVIRRSLKIAGTLARAEEDGAKIYIKEPNDEVMSRVILI